MLKGLTVLLVFQLLGEVVSNYFRLPVPGPVIGMLLLFTVLLVIGSRPSLDTASKPLIQHLSLLFLPAGVGIFFLPNHFDDQWPAILFAIIPATLISLVLTAWLLKRLTPTEKGRQHDA